MATGPSMLPTFQLLSRRGMEKGLPGLLDTSPGNELTSCSEMKLPCIMTSGSESENFGSSTRSSEKTLSTIL